MTREPHATLTYGDQTVELSATFVHHLIGLVSMGRSMYFIKAEGDFKRQLQVMWATMLTDYQATKNQEKT